MVLLHLEMKPKQIGNVVEKLNVRLDAGLRPPVLQVGTVEAAYLLNLPLAPLCP